jgi:hypothetical protein
VEPGLRIITPQLSPGKPPRQCIWREGANPANPQCETLFAPILSANQCCCGLHSAAYSMIGPGKRKALRAMNGVVVKKKKKNQNAI